MGRIKAIRAGSQWRFGLTLTEMVVAIAVCAVLAVLLVPIVVQSRAGARGVVCAETLKSLGQAYAHCLSGTGGSLPDAYYSYMGAEGTYKVSLQTADVDQPDRLFTAGIADALRCPADESPVGVFARNPGGNAATVPTSYAYNVGLPLIYRNVSRVPSPVSTVTFYDGDATGVVGMWTYSPDWALNTIRPRHSGEGNYLYLDGHVERVGSFPSDAFGGAERWLASSLDVPVTYNITGRFSNLNPSNSPNNDFILTLPDGFMITRSDLLSGKPITHGDGFSPDHLEYTGPAASITVRMKSGTKNTLTVDGQPYVLRTDVKYTITSGHMTVHLYNTNYGGAKVMGDWWLDLSASRATITMN